MSDPLPKLRVVDDQAEEGSDGVVRLKAAGSSFEPVERVAPEERAEVPERLESHPRDLFDGRSQEPGVEAILDQNSVAETVEQPWGSRDGRLGGIPYGWFVLVLLAVIGAGVWAVIQMRKGEQEVTQRLAEVRELDKDDAAEDRAARELVERIERVTKEYLAADTLEAILPLVRQPERVGPLIEAEWKVRPKLATKFVRMTLVHPATIPGGEFWIVRAETRDSEPRDLILEQKGDDDVRVDWETDVCHQPMDWDRYIAERPSGSALDFRVWITPDSYYSHEFTNAGRWRCYRITARGSEEGYLFGYVAADSEVARELDKYFEGVPDGIATAIARLRFPAGGSAPRGVVIEKVISPRWIHVTDPSKDGP